MLQRETSVACYPAGTRGLAQGEAALLANSWPGAELHLARKYCAPSWGPASSLQVLWTEDPESHVF